MLISIVVCVLNRENDVEKLLDALLSQEYKKIEILIIDNGCTDSTMDIVEKYHSDDRLKVIDGSAVKGSPYSARNLGIKASSGEIIAFMDGYPERSWVSNGLEMLTREGLDIVAGKVELPINFNSSIYEIYDSIFSLDVGYMVKKFSAAPTANLFVKKSIFSELGLFDENIRSGGDIFFTSQATSSGFKIGYCENAKSLYFTRDKNKLIEKQKRIAKGQVNIWRKKDKVNIEILKTFVKFIVPFNPITTYKRVKTNSKDTLSFAFYVKLYVLRHYLDRIRLWNTLIEAAKR